MNREEYLRQFKKNLVHISDSEKEEALRYYTEYFDEAGAENEQKVIEELGSPVILARKISAEAAIKEIDGNAQETVQPPEKRRHEGMGRNLFTIILLLCSFPIWLPLAAVAAVLVFVVILVVFIAVFCTVAVGAAFALAGVVGVLAGVVSLVTRFIDGITVAGAGMVLAGAGILLYLAGKYLMKGMIALIVALGKRKTGRI